MVLGIQYNFLICQENDKLTHLISHQLVQSGVTCCKNSTFTLSYIKKKNLLDITK